MASQQTMKPSTTTLTRRWKQMTENITILQKIHEEFAKFESTMEELHLLRCVAADLKSYRKMIKLKRYD